VYVSEQTGIISLHSCEWQMYIIVTECVYCAVRTESRTGVQVNFVLLTEINALCSQNHTKTITIASWQKAELLSSKAGGTYRYHLQSLNGLLLMQGRVRDVQSCVFYTADVGIGNL
jgi:hypothetical protein